MYFEDIIRLKIEQQKKTSEILLTCLSLLAPHDSIRRRIYLKLTYIRAQIDSKIEQPHSWKYCAIRTKSKKQNKLLYKSSQIT